MPLLQAYLPQLPSLQSDSESVQAPYVDDTAAHLHPPVDVSEWLQRTWSTDKWSKVGPTKLFDGDWESRIGFYGPGVHDIRCTDGETLLWQLKPAIARGAATALTRGQQRLQSRTGAAVLRPVTSRVDGTSADSIYLEADDCVILPESSR